jgi:hypothetical protein
MRPEVRAGLGEEPGGVRKARGGSVPGHVTTNDAAHGVRSESIPVMTRDLVYQASQGVE